MKGNEDQDRGVILGRGFAVPPPRTPPPFAPEAARAPDPAEIVVSLRQAGAPWLAPPPFRLDAQVYVMAVPAPRHVELRVPRLREERHWQQVSTPFPRRPQ
jgi:hypothetical protein